MKDKETVEVLSILVNSLSEAVVMGFMAREHAANIWKEAVKKSGFDVAKVVKGGETHVS